MTIFYMWLVHINQCTVVQHQWLNGFDSEKYLLPPSLQFPPIIKYLIILWWDVICSLFVWIDVHYHSLIFKNPNFLDTMLRRLELGKISVGTQPLPKKYNKVLGTKIQSTLDHHYFTVAITQKKTSPFHYYLPYCEGLRKNNNPQSNSQQLFFSYMNQVIYPCQNIRWRTCSAAFKWRMEIQYFQSASKKIIYYYSIDTVRILNCVRYFRKIEK